jgi:hypothetical protein
MGVTSGHPSGFAGHAAGNQPREREATARLN